MDMRFNRLVMAAALLVQAAAASAQTADEIVDKTIAALGGRAALAKLTSRATTGTIVVTTPGGDISGTIEVMNQAPNKVRTLINLDLSALGAGAVTVDQRFDGTSGYSLDSMRGNSAITGGQLDNMRNAIFPSPLLDYKDRGTKVTLVGKDKVGDRDAFALSITPASGSVVRLFVDAQTYLPAKTIINTDVPEVGPVEQSTEFSDFREVDGVQVPFKLRSSSAVQSFTVTVTKVEHNVKIDPALFVKPADK
jgi:outer membrane lipoprotein-sorting protein